ncbi:iron-containing alcohol dehydrogenase [Nocardioides jensenii]|uniref:iron-containing alcohol dehydrogenase n=1 Tax=Nocardioides jensenii TaxID=1843 RepID=UPI0009EC63B5|nr:iron-containing alcohol dehydrogenase [Nocardioides jensenii]
MSTTTFRESARERHRTTRDTTPRRAGAPPDETFELAKFHAPEVVLGTGSLAEAGFAAARLGARRPLVVTDPGIIEAGWVDELIGHLRESGLAPVIWSSVTPNPRDHEIRAAYARYAEWDCDVIIGIGGGSVADAAKGVAILSGNGGDILDYAGVDLITHPIPPLLIIPTTSGTGADVSQFCIVTDTERSVKVTILGRALVPDISITDPRLLVTMPEDLNAATGLDALTHGIEAFVSLAHNPLADTHAISAVGLVCRNLRTTMTTPKEAEARRKMAQASLQAGLAFSNAILGATHAMSHQVGGLLDAPHGVVNGVLLPHVVRYNARATPERFVELAAAAGLAVRGMPGEEAAERLADHIRGLADDIGVPRGLKELGVTEEDIPRLARTTLDDACLTTNPRLASEQEIAELFRNAL